ncbi:phosphotransferase [Amycolatopsis taiwanensis]|uniref:Trifolitoxin immunity protein n=1 Tax=Amycolatopsis taiwanensis TaxID=342230 RepID=A0A9W6VH06_9PSEU|nr:phosphotransferase [Amycolatopsis taiwanensis]GLY66997.1 trifolitoxin immunity protein [Amycolatopsis taiwanensis]
MRALLGQFERVGFELAPRYLGSSDDGTRDFVGFIPGEAAHYPLTRQQRSDETLVSAARAVRAMHDVTEDFLARLPVDGWRYREVGTPNRVDCIGHHDLAPWNILFDGTRVTGIIDWDFAAPSNRAWDLSYLAHRFVPLSSPRLTKAFGWYAEPDRAARLRLLARTYGREITPAELLDLAVVRLSAIAANIEQRIRDSDPAFAVHRDERHADGYREDVQYILQNREALLRGH